MGVERTVVEPVQAVGRCGHCASDPHDIARRKFQFRGMEDLEALSLVERQRHSILDFDPLAAGEPFGVLVKQQHVTRLIIHRVATLGVGQVGDFQLQQRPLVGAEHALADEPIANLGGNPGTFRVGR